MINDTLWVDQSQGIYPDQIIDKVKVQRPNKVVILGEFEWDMPPLTKEFVDELKLLKIELILTHCSFPCDYYTERYNNLGIKSENVIYWKTHWFNYTKVQWQNLNFDEEIKKNTNEFPFISLNNRSHIHRCALIDELAKRNFIDKGVVSWIAHLNENYNYPFKYFDRNARLFLDDDFKTQLDSFKLPSQFQKSFLHIITEATTTVPLISEKVVKALYLKKPFLTLGCYNWNNCLRELGFQLYDELFDYSYDTFNDLEIRTSKLVENIDRVLNVDLNELYAKIKDKIDYNYTRAHQILKDESFIPNLIKERLNLSESKMVEFMTIDTKYKQFIDFIK